MASNSILDGVSGGTSSLRAAPSFGGSDAPSGDVSEAWREAIRGTGRSLAIEGREMEASQPACQMVIQLTVGFEVAFRGACGQRVTIFPGGSRADHG